MSYWVVDALKKGEVKTHLSEIESFFKENDKSKKLSIIETKLSNLLRHANETTIFYNAYRDHINNFPIINKTIIRDNYDAFISNQFQKENLIKLTTSGSTGTPFQVFQDKNKKARNTADTLYFAARTNYKLGQKLFYLKIWSDANRKSPFQSFMQNVEMIDVILLNDKSIATLLEKIKKETSPFGIIGYASAIEQVCQYVERTECRKIKCNLVSAITISESLSQFAKDTFEKYFGIPLISRYSNIENGILAQQCNHFSNEFHLNTASYFTEIFDLDKDIPLQDGQLGRIVVTDYYNYGMPLIRYDTGDIGSISKKSHCEFATPVLNRLEGRKLDLLYNTQKEVVSSLLVYKNMWKYTSILQYQLVQKGIKEYIVRINIDGYFDRENEMIAEYKSFLGEDAEVSIEYVDDIPLLSSGKRKKVVNEYYPS